MMENDYEAEAEPLLWVFGIIVGGIGWLYVNQYLWTVVGASLAVGLLAGFGIGGRVYRR